MPMTHAAYPLDDSHDPQLEAATAAILAAGRRLCAGGISMAHSGNISLRLDQGFLITRSGVAKGYLTAADLCLLAADGQAEPGSATPSSERALHLACYQNPAVHAVIHSHAPYASAFALNASLAQTLQQSPLEELTHYFRPLPLLPYQPAGSAALAQAVGQACLSGAAAALLERHGIVVWGRDLEEALARTESLEQAAKTVLAARLLAATLHPSPATDR